MTIEGIEERQCHMLRDRKCIAIAIRCLLCLAGTLTSIRCISQSCRNIRHLDWPVWTRRMLNFCHQVRMCAAPSNSCSAPLPCALAVSIRRAWKKKIIIMYLSVIIASSLYQHTHTVVHSAHNEHKNPEIADYEYSYAK